ncbi:MAG: hypothetical protein PWP11_837 [Thauera sp.]|nr:hypothetical protein [Thauera sp.]MDI3489560.1 hypothetical protein [Thauera sp.]
MFAVESPIITHLQADPSLAGWAVRSGAQETSRRPMPAIEIVCEHAEVEDARAGGVMVSVMWGVYLVAPYEASVMASLDRAFGAAVAALHNWSPGVIEGRAWSPLKLTKVGRPEIAEQGLVAYSLIFHTTALYKGQGA